MIQLNIMGRMGNQMFQYAYARAVQEKTGQDLIINWGNVLNYKGIDGGFENSLKHFNIVKYKEEMQLQMSFSQRLVDKLFERGILRNRWDEYNRYILEKKWAKFLNFFGLYYMRSGFYNFTAFKHDNIILSGNFESPKYMSDIDELLRIEFTPKYPVLEKNISLLNDILTHESICISIRRGDYYSRDINKRLRVCTPDYYIQGVEYILNKIPNAKLFVFSDDIEWVKTNVVFPCAATYESGDDPVWEKMRLMYSCKHFVIANSTFSWWAQHLSSNENKIVVAPSKWIIDENDSEELKSLRKSIYEDNWVLLDV